MENINLTPRIIIKGSLSGMELYKDLALQYKERIQETRKGIKELISLLQEDRKMVRNYKNKILMDIKKEKMEEKMEKVKGKIKEMEEENLEEENINIG